jgi:hypothetical protein
LENPKGEEVKWKIKRKEKNSRNINQDSLFVLKEEQGCFLGVFVIFTIESVIRAVDEV